MGDCQCRPQDFLFSLSSHKLPRDKAQVTAITLSAGSTFLLSGYLPETIGTYFNAMADIILSVNINGSKRCLLASAK